MFGFLRSLFAPQSSSETAKERLRVVLLADHLSLTPEIVDLLKADLLAVIRKYAEIDEKNVDLTFEQREKEVAMLASVPILSVRGSISERESIEDNKVVEAVPEVNALEDKPPVHVSTDSSSTALEEEEIEEEAEPPEEGSTATIGGRRRKRRRNRQLEASSASSSAPIAHVQSL